MKKMLTILMMLVLAFCLTACSASHKVISDPVLEPVMIDGIPEGTYTNLGDDLIFVSNQKTYSAQDYCIFNLKSGKSTPLSLKDEAKWRAMYEERLARNPDAYHMQLAMLDKKPLIDVLLTDYLQIYQVGENYSHCLIGPISCLLNHRSGEMIYLEKLQKYAVGPMSRGEFVSWEHSKDDALTISKYSVNEKLLRTVEVHVDSSAHFVPMKDGLLMIIRNPPEDGAPSSTINVIILDSNLNTSTEFTLTAPDLFITKAHQHKKNGRVLLQTREGIILVDPASGSSCLITCIDDQVSVSEFAQHTEPLLNEDMPPTIPLEVLGFSPDDSYALIATMSPGLYKLDMETLELTEQMTKQEIEAALNAATALYKPNMDFSTVDWALTTWDGGEYAVSPQCIFRVKER